jgi:hypothetical protein
MAASAGVRGFTERTMVRHAAASLAARMPLDVVDTRKWSWVYRNATVTMHKAG